MCAHTGERMGPPHYKATGQGHVLMNRTRGGDRAVLEDRSIWTLDPSEMARARHWPQWTRIRVQAAGGNAYWLIAEILGQRECVLAVFAGFLSASTAIAQATSDFYEPEL